MVSDENFIAAIGELNRLGARYWLMSGTLLGIVRDGDLIPWDGDIDIAVKTDDFDVWRVGPALCQAGFRLGYWDGMTSVHFYRPGGRKLDINAVSVIQRDGQLEYATIWRNEEEFPRLYRALRSRAVGISVKQANKVFVRNSSTHILASLYLAALRSIVFLGNALFRPNRFGYFIPHALLEEFTVEDIDGLRVTIPSENEAVLRVLYGNSWRTPYKSRRWTEFTKPLGSTEA